MSYLSTSILHLKIQVQPKTNAKASPKAKSTLVSTDSPSVPEQVQIQMYLSFFHSSNTPKDNNKNKQNEEGRIALTDVRKTYKMGAFLFSAQPPFAVRVGLRLRFKGLFLYTVGVLCNVKWCIRQTALVFFNRTL